MPDRECGGMENGGAGSYVVCSKCLPLGYISDPYWVPCPPRGAARAPPIFTQFLLSEFSMPPVSLVFRMREPNLGGYCIPPSTLPTQHTNNLVYPSFWATATKTHFFRVNLGPQSNPLPTYQIQPNFVGGRGHPRML